MSDFEKRELRQALWQSFGGFLGFSFIFVLVVCLIGCKVRHETELIRTQITGINGFPLFDEPGKHHMDDTIDQFDYSGAETMVKEQPDLRHLYLYVMDDGILTHLENEYLEAQYRKLKAEDLVKCDLPAESGTYRVILPTSARTMTADEVEAEWRRMETRRKAWELGRE